ncbi:MAG: pyruvate kinase [Candidatus Ancaeobacter aquaticus]|nr:pyruvate kinase [Candidatus Ancaeobacter aquaticus]
MTHKTKILATLGPATSSEKMIKSLICTGVDAFRLNFSHSTHDEHKKLIRIIRKISKELKTSVSIVQDLGGPKIRVGTVNDEKKVYLKKGNSIRIVKKEITGDENCISTNYGDIVNAVKIGQRILINDGIISLRVKEKKNNELICDIIAGGLLSSRKGINLPETKLSLPSLTDKDKKDLLFGLTNNVDYIALSFVRSVSDIQMLKSIIMKQNKKTPVIAKIEKPEAIKNIDAIIDAVDGIMIARGDLAIETAIESVPIYQKKIIQKCREKHVLVITATQMLESMVENAVPTRAEASDVANAIIDGTDCVMLSAETSVGKYPVRVVSTMRRIIKSAQQSLWGKTDYIKMLHLKGYIPQEAISHSACLAADEMGARAIVVFTLSSKTARLIASRHPQTKIIALTPHSDIVRQLYLVWGVTPICYNFNKNGGLMFEKAIDMLISQKYIAKGNILVIVTGETHSPALSNMLKILQL